MLFYHYHWKNR